MDLGPVAGSVGGAITALGALVALFREKSRRAALEAERALENERQETALVQQLVARQTSLEARLDTQAETIAAQASQIATLSSDRQRLQQQVNELAADNVRLAGRVVELERERDEATRNAKQIKREYRRSLGLPESEPPKLAR